MTKSEYIVMHTDATCRLKEARAQVERRMKRLDQEKKWIEERVNLGDYEALQSHNELASIGTELAAAAARVASFQHILTGLETICKPEE